MNVLIKGMEMPKDGRRHKALVIFEPDGTCKIVCEYSESYSERHIKTFEAIELPPHGRLIDAEWLNEMLRGTLELLIKDTGLQGPYLFAAFSTLGEMVKDAPTIIEAEVE